MFVLTWVIAGLLTGAAGILVGPMWFADVNMGDPIALKAFAAIIIGGFSSVPGAIVGGLLIGVVEQLAGLADEGFAALVFFGARPLADKQPVGLRVADTQHRLLARLAQIAGATIGDAGFEFGPVYGAERSEA